MVNVTELRNGTVFEEQGQLLQVISYEHIKMGRGSANIKVKVRNVRTGATTEKSFINGARVNDVKIPKRDMQYLYKDEDFLYFMDPSSFEQVQLNIEKFPEYIYLKEGENFTLSFLGEEVLSINLPPKMDLKVVETGPNIKGNSTANIYKDAELENGLKTKVPLFIKVDDVVRIDTRTGAYSEKV